MLATKYQNVRYQNTRLYQTSLYVVPPAMVVGPAPEAVPKPGQLRHMESLREWYSLQMRHSWLREPVEQTHLLVVLLQVAELSHGEEEGMHLPCLA